jgi:ParB/RepB/Spo0J family partition protein
MTTFANIRLDAIAPSLTNPRKTFDPARLDELTASIKASGVHQPVLLRPLPADRLQDTAHLSPRPEFELVAGERRWRASKAAGLDTIPAMVRAMTDEEVLEIQVVENLQRDDLTALEEAQGYEVLMNHSGITAEQVAEKIGKSRTYVFNRLKLMDLGQDGREALRMGMLDASKALLLARIPDTTLQVKALQEILRPNHPEGVMSARMAGDWIRSRYMLKLEQAPFNMSDTSFVQGSCSGCLKRTGAAPDIFADVKGADVCTDPSCYDNKVQVHRTRVRDALEADGHTVIDEREAKEIMPYAMSALVGYARLDDNRDSPTDRTLREELASVLESGELKPVMVANPHKEGELIACIPEEEVTRWLTKAGRKEAVKAAKQASEADQAHDAERHERELKEEYETGWRLRVVREIKDGLLADSDCKIPRQVQRILAERALESLYTELQANMADLLSLNKDTSGMANDERLNDWLSTVALGNDPEWVVSDALLLIEAVGDSGWNRYNPSHWASQTADNNVMLAMADARDIDIDAIKSALQAEMTEREAQKAAEKQAALDAAKAPLPLAPAAQANGVRGEAKAKKAKGKKTPADAGAGLGRLSAQEAMQGIADALQDDEAPDAARRSEAISGADAPGEGVGPASRPDGAAQNGQRWPFGLASKSDPSAQAEAGGATPSLASQAGAVDQADGASVMGEQEVLGVGSRVRVIFDSPTFKGKVGTVSAINSKGTASIALDGFESEFTFQVGEFEWVEGGAA